MSARPLNLETVGEPFEAAFTFDWSTVATYALGVGAGPDALHLTWEKHPKFATLPGFAVVPVTASVMRALVAIGADFDRLVHGAQGVVLHRAIPTSGELVTVARVTEVLDKGKGAVVVVETQTHQKGEPSPLFDTRWSIFCRGQGGFGGSRGTRPVLPEPTSEQPQATMTAQTRPDQALIYRLSGDTNPLHVDPAQAAKAGFPRPILHGLCTYGFAIRAAIDAVGGGDPAALRAFSARFSGVVLPGDALTFRVFETAEPHLFRLDAAVGDRAVLSHGVVEVAR